MHVTRPEPKPGRSRCEVTVLFNNVTVPHTVYPIQDLIEQSAELANDCFSTTQRLECMLSYLK